MPPYASQERQKMIDLGTYTINDMVKEMADKGESHPPTQTVSKRTRNRKSHQPKSKATVGSDDYDSNDDKAIKASSSKDSKALRNRHRNPLR